MICEKCGCDYARSRPARPECGTPAPGYEKWATGGVDPALPARRRGWRRFRRADAPRSAGRSRASSSAATSSALRAWRRPRFSAPACTPSAWRFLSC
ncbi:MAG: hypothetical protein ACLTDR_15500 [Adlercreutzia equolifaciens]